MVEKAERTNAKGVTIYHDILSRSDARIHIYLFWDDKIQVELRFIENSISYSPSEPAINNSEYVDEFEQVANSFKVLR